MLKKVFSIFRNFSKPLDLVVYTDLLTANARLLLQSAYAIAQSKNHCSLTPEHILMAFANSNPSFFQEIAESLNLTPNLITYELSIHLDKIEEGRSKTLRDDTRTVMSNALKHAQGRENERKQIETVDLIIGIFENKDSNAVNLFKRIGVEEGEIIKRIKRKFDESPA